MELVLKNMYEILFSKIINSRISKSMAKSCRLEMNQVCSHKEIHTFPRVGYGETLHCQLSKISLEYNHYKQENSSYL